jgi:hypothetical protein
MYFKVNKKIKSTQYYDSSLNQKTIYKRLIFEKFDFFTISKMNNYSITPDWSFDRFFNVY